MQGGCKQQRISAIQVGKPMALTSISRHAKRYSRYVFLRPKENGRENEVQSPPGHFRRSQVLPSGSQAERLDSSSDLRSDESANAGKSEHGRAGLRHYKPCRRQRRQQGGESSTSQAVPSPSPCGSKEDFTSKEKQSSEKESVSDGRKNSRKNYQSAPGLLAQSCTELRRTIRNHCNRRFEPVRNGAQSPSGPFDNGRILGDAATIHRSQSCKCWTNSHRGSSILDIPKMLIMRRHGPEGVKRKNAFMPLLRILGLSGRKCGQEHFKAGAQPSGRGCNSGLYDLRSTGVIR